MKKLLGFIFMFSLFSIFAFFSALFIFQVGDELILTPIQNMSNNSGINISVQMQTHINDSLAGYKNLNVPFDLYFLTSLILTFISSIWVSFKNREESFISFFGLITIGLLGFLFMAGIVNSIADWIVLNMITNFLGFDITSTPIFNWYITNLTFINFIWASILLLVNKLPFTLRREQDINDSTLNNEGFQR